MIYTLDDGQLLSIWTVINQLGLIREIPDPTDRLIFPTRAQALLTMLALGVCPLPRDRNDATTVGPGPNGVAGFDAQQARASPIHPDSEVTSNTRILLQWTVSQPAQFNLGSW